MYFYIQLAGFKRSKRNLDLRHLRAADDDDLILNDKAILPFGAKPSTAMWGVSFVEDSLGTSTTRRVISTKALTVK
jgi:hypothetical protein